MSCQGVLFIMWKRYAVKSRLDRSKQESIVMQGDNSCMWTQSNNVLYLPLQWTLKH